MSNEQIKALELQAEPTMEKYGWYSAQHPEEESGWMYEGGEEAYYKALSKYNQYNTKDAK